MNNHQLSGPFDRKHGVSATTSMASVEAVLRAAIASKP